MSNGGVVGWDIGGVNTKVARVRRGEVLAVHVHPYELQRDPAALAPLIGSLARQVGATDADRHAVTMTAELSQMFRTKREGVAFVLDAVATALPHADVRVYTVHGQFIAPAGARCDPLSVAASNWAATAHMVARDHSNAILLDTGTTTTDIIPIADGRVAAAGYTDPARLASGELVYTGALRTPVEAIATHVPLGQHTAGVSAEGFALAGDVHVWRGDLAPADYTVPTPDARPATRPFAGERLARVVCADREMLDDNDISAIADMLADAQIDAIARAIARVRARYPSLGVAIVTGLGAFLATAAARRAGLDVIPLADRIGADASRCAPAAAVALLLERQHTAGDRSAAELASATAARAVIHVPGRRSAPAAPNDVADPIDAAVKIGGGLLRFPDHLETVLAAVRDAARSVRLVVVPGGGPFAETVRGVDRQLGVGDDAAHWMAVLAMDQYAHLLVSRHRDFALVATPGEMGVAFRSTTVPVLAPSRWLRDADALPHSWDVTSDSIAAWVAGAIGATRLVLVKPPGVRGDDVVDAYFTRALPPDVRPTIAAADQLELLRSALRGTSER